MKRVLCVLVIVIPLAACTRPAEPVLLPTSTTVDGKVAEAARTRAAIKILDDAYRRNMAAADNARLEGLRLLAAAQYKERLLRIAAADQAAAAARAAAARAAARAQAPAASPHPRVTSPPTTRVIRTYRVVPRHTVTTRVVVVRP